MAVYTWDKRYGKLMRKERGKKPEPVCALIQGICTREQMNALGEFLAHSLNHKKVQDKFNKWRDDNE